MIKKIGFVAGVIALGAVAGASTATIKFWDDYGWVTRYHYRMDHATMLTGAQTTEIFDLLEDLKVGQKANQEEWKCDELDEEILDLELTLLEVETNAEKVPLNRKIEKSKERWDRLDCTRFEDDA